MTTLAAFLLSITGSLAARVMTSLGIGVFSYAAISTLISTIQTNISTNYGLIDSVVLSILNLAGGGTILGILIAAMVTRASMQAIKKMRPI